MEKHFKIFIIVVNLITFSAYNECCKDVSDSVFFHIKLNVVNLYYRRVKPTKNPFSRKMNECTKNYNIDEFPLLESLISLN